LPTALPSRAAPSASAAWVSTVVNQRAYRFSVMEMVAWPRGEARLPQTDDERFDVRLPQVAHSPAP